MTPPDLLRRRLANQRLMGLPFGQPAEAVAGLGAVQSQDYAAAKWALALRLPGASEAALDRAFNDGAILRTHVMRPTWHFVAPADIRWLLALTAPRVERLIAQYDRQVGVDAAVRRRGQAVFAKALQGGRALTRTELDQALRAAGLSLAPLGRTHVVMHAELDGLLCSGPRRGKQFTYMLLEERVPPAAALGRDEALAELAWRYFSSHGPALVSDFVWWSGLTAADAKQGLALAGPRLACEGAGGQDYWFDPAQPAPRAMTPLAYLLPNYDEYTVAYAARDDFYDVQAFRQPVARDNVPFANVILLKGRVAGIWKRTIAKRAVTVETKFLQPPSEAERRAVAAAAKRFGEFLGLPVVMA